jgi:hypothetical protein
MKKSLVLAVLTVAVVLLVGVTSACADTVTIPGGTYVANTATDVVTVSATVNPKLVLEVVTPGAGQTVDFGACDPGTAYGPQPVTLTVWSNRGYSIATTKANDAAIGLSTVNIDGAYAKSASNAGATFNDSYSLNVPWTTDPGAYTATVLYTVLQN